MADTELPPEDESAGELLGGAIEFLAASWDGWEPSTLAFEYAMLAAGADEDAILYALLRARDSDWLRDLGEVVYGVPPIQPAPAVATVTWTSRRPAPEAGLELDAGTSLVIDAPSGRHGFYVVNDAVLAEGETVLEGVLVQAYQAGSAARGADGPVLLDTPPEWVLEATLDAPAVGGSDGDTDAEHELRIVRTSRLQSKSPIHADDLELAAQDVDTVYRALVRDNYNLATDDDDVEGHATVWPIQRDGSDVSDATEALVQARCAGPGRRILNGTIHVGKPTRTPIGAACTVIPRAGRDPDLVEAETIAAIAAQLSPATHGLLALGEIPVWRMRRTLRPYETAAAVDRLESIDEVTDLELTSTVVGVIDGDGNAVLEGAAPLPEPDLANITVTVLDANP